MHAYRNFGRPSVVALLLLLPLFAACGSDHDDDVTPTPTATSIAPTATPTTVPTVTPTRMRDVSAAEPAAFTAHGSVEQLYVTGAAAQENLELVDASGDVVMTGTADAEGSLIFREVPAGLNYAVASGYPNDFAASNAVEVTHPDDPPAQSFYDSQELKIGYGYLTTRDGTKLAYSLYLPGPIDRGPYPTVVEYSGYDPANPGNPQPSTRIALALGYAVLGVNMRGTGCSGGAFQFFETLQATDGYDIIEIVASQPWAKHNHAGMVGLSYPGITQLFVGRTRPPHLAAIAPLSVISDTGRGILYPGGILNNGFAVEWSADRQHDAQEGGQPWSRKRLDDGDQVCIDNMKLRGQTPNILELISANPFYVASLVDPVSPITFVHKINAPVFLSGAWQDEQTGGYFPNMLHNFTGTDLLHFTMTNGHHIEALDPLVFVRWAEFLDFYVAREIPDVPPTAIATLLFAGQMIFGTDEIPIEEPRFDDAASYEEALAEFEAEPKVRILFENGTGGITPLAPVPGFEKNFTDWPIPSTEPAIWYFDADGTLTKTPPTGSGADKFRYDPSLAQATSQGSGDADLWGVSPNLNWRRTASGAEVSYATNPLAETLVMAGSGSIDLWIQSTADDTDLQVTLSEVRPDGKELYIQNGWLRASHRKLDPAQSTILRPVQSHLEVDAASLPAGQFVEARVELYPFAHVFRAGSQIRIAIAAPGGSRPRWKFDALPADGDVFNTISRSAERPSRIVLPVIPDVEVTTPLPICAGYRGQPCRDYVESPNTPAS